MSSEPNTPETTAIVEVSPQTDALVETEMASESDEVRRETKALIEAIRKRAQVEMQTAGNYTRDAYLNAVRQARESIENNQLFEPERIDRSVQLLQHEAEKNWNYVISEIESLGTQLAATAKTAWDTLMNLPSKLK